MRVLICIEALGIGGKERQAVELVKGLASTPDVQCVVVCLETDRFYLHELTNAKIHVEFVPRTSRWDVEIFHKLHGIIKDSQPDVIHTNGLMSSFYALPLARLMRIPLINGSIRNAFSTTGFRWSLERLLLKLSDYRVANSYAGLRSRNFPEKEGKNIVIHNGFDFSRLERMRHRSSPGQCVGDTRVKTIGMVAEFNRFKDYSTFIDAARKITRRRGDVVFVTVGDGETLEASRRQASGVGPVRFLGKRKNVEEIIQSFDIGVLCTFVEGFPNSIMEYMALGRPVVATDGGGTRELVVDGETGLLVPPANADAVAAKIEYLLDNPTTARRMGEAGEARLRRNFSITKMVEETIRLYRLAIANSNGVDVRDHWSEGGAQP